MKKVILFLSIYAFSAMCYSFRLPVTFYKTVAETSMVTVGVEPGATDGYNIGLDVPAFPPFTAFAAQIVNDSFPISNLSTDIRSDLMPRHIWRVQLFNFVAPGSHVRWNRFFVPHDSIRSTWIGYGTSPDTIDWFGMTEDDSFFVPAGYYAFIKFVQVVEPPVRDTIPPRIFGWSPADGDTNVDPMTSISFSATDETALDTSRFSVHLWVDGTDYGLFATQTPIAGGIRVTYTPFFPFTAGATVLVTAQVQDRASPPNVASQSISFRIASDTPPETTYCSITAWVNLMGGFPPPPLSGSKVDIAPLGLSDTTNSTGMVTFDDIPSGSYTVVASRVGYFSAGTSILLTRDTMLVFVLEADTGGGGGGIAIRGTVTLEGALDYSGTSLQLLGVMDSSVRYDTTTITGNYEFTGVMPGLYKLTAMRTGYFPDSAFVFAFFSDTIVDFHLNAVVLPFVQKILVIDWDNGDRPLALGIGAAEGLYNYIISRYPTLDVGITTQDPNIASLNLDSTRAIFLVTGTRLGMNAMMDDASISALMDFVNIRGGAIYWEGADAGKDYSAGTAIARSFFNMFGAEYAHDGMSATTGNIENIALKIHAGSGAGSFVTVGYAFMTEADHFIDELNRTTGEESAYSTTGPTPTFSRTRGVRNGRKFLNSFYLAAVQNSVQRNAYLYGVLYVMLGWTDIAETEIPKRKEIIRIEPNPFNSSCKIAISGNAVRAEIYDISGRMLFSWVSVGEHIWDGRDMSGKTLPSGSYLVVARDCTGKIVDGRKISFVR